MAVRPATAHFNGSIISVRCGCESSGREPCSSCQLHQRARRRATFDCWCSQRSGRAAAASTASASTTSQLLSCCTTCVQAQLLCGVQLLWNHLSAEFWSCRSTHFTVTIPVTNAPIGTVPIVRNTERCLRAASPPVPGFESEAAVVRMCVLRVSVCELRLSNRTRVCLSAASIV